jgi:S-adenosylmethionine decarboxylase proenzyme
MFSNYISSGKHLIADIKNIKNTVLLNDIILFKKLFDEICDINNFTILDKIQYIFEPSGFSIIYLLSESHISVHTFPEKNYCSIDLYCCRIYDNNDVYNNIYNFIITNLDANKDIVPVIIDRFF